MLGCFLPCGNVMFLHRYYMDGQVCVWCCQPSFHVKNGWQHHEIPAHGGDGNFWTWIERGPTKPNLIQTWLFRGYVYYPLETEIRSFRSMTKGFCNVAFSFSHGFPPTKWPFQTKAFDSCFIHLTITRGYVRGETVLSYFIRYWQFEARTL